jgi:SagB-type dehydrogenase family enzyme
MEAFTLMNSGPPSDAIETILAYHRRTKHHLSRYARGPDGLDWANQPDPFRTFAGAARVELPLLADGLATTYGEVHVPGAARVRRIDLTSVAVLCELSLGLSAWKEYRGSRWALRCNPSSGNLHPTEGYLVLPPLPDLDAGLYHYDSHDHALEQRCRLSTAGAARMPTGAFLVGLSSVHWREAWKYGERAYRYCQHDLGHAIAAVRYAAAALGWSAWLLDDLSDAEVSAWLGLDREADFPVHPLDREHPGALLLVGPGPLDLTPDLRALEGGTWSGRANALSRSHVHWSIIDEAARVSTKERTAQKEHIPPPLPPLSPALTMPAATLIRQRRSCLGLDGQTGMDAAALYRILDHLLPRAQVPPWDVLPWPPQIDLALFVHRVRGLEQGLYLFERIAGRHEERRQAFSARFIWQRVEGCPEHLRLYRLATADLRALAQKVSCHQDIASDGAFSLGMLAWHAEGIREKGARWYRRLFWEAGVLGQVLYLEAEAAGLRGTGIGCFFDDAVHQVLGLVDERWQSLYHFTIGGPVEDRRLRTIAPYAHLGGR